MSRRIRIARRSYRPIDCPVTGRPDRETLFVVNRIGTNTRSGTWSREPHRPRNTTHPVGAVKKSRFSKTSNRIRIFKRPRSFQPNAFFLLLRNCQRSSFPRDGISVGHVRLAFSHQCCLSRWSRTSSSLRRGTSAVLPRGIYAHIHARGRACETVGGGGGKRRTARPPARSTTARRAGRQAGNQPASQPRHAPPRPPGPARSAGTPDLV